MDNHVLIVSRIRHGRRARHQAGRRSGEDAAALSPREPRYRLAILGFRSNGTIVSWLPLFLFVVLFGLSMDYHVFILSRVREAVDRGEPPR
jgi:hypothetical protein